MAHSDLLRELAATPAGRSVLGQFDEVGELDCTSVPLPVFLAILQRAARVLSLALVRDRQLRRLALLTLLRGPALGEWAADSPAPASPFDFRLPVLVAGP